MIRLTLLFQAAYLDNTLIDNILFFCLGRMSVQVMAYDSGAPWRGPLFRVPITVVKPVAVGPAAPVGGSLGGFSLGGNGEVSPHFAARFRRLDFAAGAEHRRFVAVPEGATWCEMRLTAAAGLPNPCNYFVRATQLRPAQRFSDGEGARAYVQLAANQEWVHSFAVQVTATANPVPLYQALQQCHAKSCLALAVSGIYRYPK